LHASLLREHKASRRAPTCGSRVKLSVDTASVGFYKDQCLQVFSWHGFLCCTENLLIYLKAKDIL